MMKKKKKNYQDRGAVNGSGEERLVGPDLELVHERGGCGQAQGEGRGDIRPGESDGTLLEHRIGLGAGQGWRGGKKKKR